MNVEDFAVCVCEVQCNIIDYAFSFCHTQKWAEVDTEKPGRTDRWTDGQTDGMDRMDGWRVKFIIYYQRLAYMIGEAELETQESQV